ncbi:MAG: metallophosphoesterase [Oligoflexales bacterium]
MARTLPIFLFLLAFTGCRKEEKGLAPRRQPLQSPQPQAPVGSPGGGQPSADATGIPLGKNNKKYCFIGDTGTGEKKQLDVASALQQQGCGMIFHTGDIIYDQGIKNKDDPEFIAKFWDPYKKILEEDKVPFYMVAGNHDWESPGTADAWKEVAKAHPDVIYYPHYWYATWLNREKTACLFVFDTQVDAAKQEEFFEKEKGNFAGCRFSIAMGHHPYAGARKTLKAEGEFKKMIEKSILGHFDLYISGHMHQLEDVGVLNNSGTRQLISGAGARLHDLDDKPGDWAEVALGYLVLVESGTSEMKYQFVDVNNKPLREATYKGVGLR